MNIFIVHSGENLKEAKEYKEKLHSLSRKANILLLEYKKFLWKKEAEKFLKKAQMILYIVGEKSYLSKNIDWELKKALSYSKSIMVLKLNENFKLNKCLYKKDDFTKEEIMLADEVKSIEEVSKVIDDYEKGNYINLFNHGKEMSKEELFEQYKLFTETSEGLVNRRQNVNSFYITTNTALITIAATVGVLDGSTIAKLIVFIALSFPGILLNSSWKKILESYGITNSSKLKIIGMLEKELSASIYDAEWDAMSNKYNKKKYVSFTDSEKAMPSIFSACYIVTDMICLVLIIALKFFA